MPNQFLSPEGDLENYFVTEYWLIDQYVGDTLWVWGQNYWTQLGDFTKVENRSTPVTTFAGGTNWKQVHNGTVHTSAIKTDGTLWIWGRNFDGELGINDTTGDIFRCTPVTTFAGGTNWKQVAGGLYYTAAIKTDGTLWTWGRNSSGQLGTNDTITRLTPVTTFAGGTNWKQVAHGSQSNHTAAIKTDGTLWIWGGNSYGQLGVNDAGAGLNRSTPVTTFAGGTNWKQVASGNSYTAAIKTDGTLWGWGNNVTYGNLGINNLTSRICTPVTTFAGGTNWKQVACGFRHTAAIKTDGTLWTWGYNNDGQNGNGGGIQRIIPGQTYSGGTNWKQVACAPTHTAAIKTDGSLWVWGSASNGKLGNTFISLYTTYVPVTTFAGGNSWKQVSCSDNNTAAVTSGTDPTYFIS